MKVKEFIKHILVIGSRDSIEDAREIINKFYNQVAERAETATSMMFGQLTLDNKIRERIGRGEKVKVLLRNKKSIL